ARAADEDGEKSALSRQLMNALQVGMAQRTNVGRLGRETKVQHPMRELVARPFRAADQIAFLQQGIERLESRVLRALQLAAEFGPAPDRLLRKDIERVQHAHRSLVHRSAPGDSNAMTPGRQQARKALTTRLRLCSLN